MKKISLALVGGLCAVALGWLLATAYTGHRLAQDVQTQVAAWNDGLPWGDLSLLEYERGWLRSRARWQLTLDEAALPAPLVAPEPIVLTSEIEHGPWPAARLSRARFFPVLARVNAVPEPGGGLAPWFAAAQDAEPLRLTLDIDYAGSVEFVARIAALQLTQDETDLRTSAADLTGSLDAHGRPRALRGALGQARIATVVPGLLDHAETVLELQGLRWESEHRPGAFGLFPGMMSLIVDQWQIETIDDRGSPLRVRVRDYRVWGELQETADVVRAEMQYDIGELSVDETELGRIHATVAVGELPGEVVRHIVQRYQVLMAEGDITQREDPRLQDWAEQSWRALLPHQPQIALDPLRWELPQGRSWLQVTATLQPEVPGHDVGMLSALQARLVVSRAMAIEVMARLAQLPGGSGRGMAQARAAASLNMAFVERLALAAGYIVVDDDALMTQITYEQGRWHLNGEPLRLPGEWESWLPLP